MTDAFRALALRICESLHLDADVDTFGTDTCWSIVQYLEQLMINGRPLDSLTLRLLSEITTEIKPARGDAAHYLQALESQLGPSPIPLETIASLLDWARGQIHFVEKKKPVELGSSAGGSWVPLKNLDYD